MDLKCIQSIPQVHGTIRLVGEEKYQVYQPGAAKGQYDNVTDEGSGCLSLPLTQF